MCAEGQRPVCQDTGIVTVFAEIGMDVSWDADLSFEEMVNEGVRQAYTLQDNKLRASILADPAGARTNTGDNTPAVIHTRVVPGESVSVRLAAKGGGSEAKSKLAMLNPSEDIVDWVVRTVPTMGAGWCPPGMLGIGIGGTSEKAMLMAKETLMEPIDIHELIARGPRTTLEELRLQIYDSVNALGIGAQGLGGLTTVLDVKIKDYPTHAANKPVALIPNCAATRHTHFTLRGDGPDLQEPPRLAEWPTFDTALDSRSRRVSLDSISKQEIATWKAGDTLLINGKILTGRDAAHQRLRELTATGQSLPDGLDFNGRFLYYVGPVDPVREEAVGPAGPTTATRMDVYTDMMLGDNGLFGMIGKAERGPETTKLIGEHKACYLVAIGGAAYLVSKAIKSSRIVAFEDLGMEAIREFEVEDMPVMVAVDSQGRSVHVDGPREWQKIIFERRNAQRG